MPDQATGTLTFNRPKLSQTAPASVVSECRVATPNENQVKVEQYISLDPSAIIQTSTVTITAGATSDVYSLAIAGDAPPTSGTSNVTLAPGTALYRQKNADTPTIIAQNLAKQLNEDPRVNAKASNGTITITGAVAGLAFTLDNAGSTAVGNVTIATTTPASGSVRHVKIMEANLIYSVDPTGLPLCDITVQWFTGDATSVEFQAPVKYAAKGPRSLDTIQIANGIPRPA